MPYGRDATQLIVKKTNSKLLSDSHALVSPSRRTLILPIGTAVAYLVLAIVRQLLATRLSSEFFCTSLSRRLSAKHLNGPIGSFLDDSPLSITPMCDMIPIAIIAHCVPFLRGHSLPPHIILWRPTQNYRSILDGQKSEFQKSPIKLDKLFSIHLLTVLAEVTIYYLFSRSDYSLAPGVIVI